MGYNKGTYLQKKIKTLSNFLLSLKIVKFFFFIYSFLAFLFWLLNCFDFEWLYFFNWLFIPPYQLVGFVYRPTGLQADFTLAIIGLMSLLFGFLFEYFSVNLYKKIAEAQDELEKYNEQKKRAKPRRARPIPVGAGSRSLNANGLPSFMEDNHVLIFLIQAHVQKIKKNSAEEDLTPEEDESYRQRINKRILEYIKDSQSLQKGYYRKNLFLVYKNFNYVDDFISLMHTTVHRIISEFEGINIKVQFNYVMSSTVQISSYIEKELDLADTILSLNFINMFVLTEHFKMEYDNIATKKYEMVLKGEYNLSKNLSVSNLQPLYKFKNM